METVLDGRGTEQGEVLFEVRVDLVEECIFVFKVAGGLLALGKEVCDLIFADDSHGHE